MSASRPPKNLRLFVAAYPPPEIAVALLASLGQLDLPPGRLVPPQQVHLTLHFIGETPVAKIDSIVETVRHAARGMDSFALTPWQLITLPKRPPVRLVAAETDQPAALMELQRRLVSRLARNPRHTAGDRFRPHLTLCRLGPATKLAAIEAPLGVPPFLVETIALVRSTLDPLGAHHDLVRGIDLSRRSASEPGSA
jgi:2'-5' RNA ligase